MSGRAPISPTIEYGEETNHGVNLTPQQKWDTLIHKCIVDNKPLPNR